MSRALSPRSLAAAVEALAADPALVPAAGCTDLMVPGPAAMAELPGVLDLLRVPEMRGIETRDGGLEVGATATFTELRRSPEVARRFPALAAAASVVGGWQIQNRATLGGNIANASPAGDSLPVLLALDAVVVAAGPDGEREIPYRGFHVGYRRTALGPAELVARVRLPVPPPGSVQLFRKVGTREAQAISKVVVAAVGRVVDGAIAGLSVAAGSVAATPVRLAEVEEALIGRPADGETAELAGELASRAVTPIDDVRSTAVYRRHALGRVVRRMVLELGASAAPGPPRA